MTLCATGAPDGTHRVSRARRTLDVIAAASALTLLSPVLLLLAAAVKSESRGPILFRQRRIGCDGAEFTLLKLRSMSAGDGGAEITADVDPRVTRVGAVLRRTSLDELPQLVNILRGEMTLVGPRPETPGLARRYPDECRWVLQHVPGLTGPTQVWMRGAGSIPADVTDIEQWYLDRLVPRRVAMDWTYLRDPSLSATFAVLWATTRHILNGGSAPSRSDSATLGGLPVRRRYPPASRRYAGRRDLP